MATRIVLHIGAMKSGTSFIQKSLFRNQAALREKGVLVPGGRWRAQVLAISNILGGRKRGRISRKGAWSRLRAEVDAWSGDAVVSMEFMGAASVKAINRIVAEFPDTVVEAVLTVRDLNRSIPSMWQEGLKNGKTHSWEEYRGGIERGEGRPAKTFWRQQDWVVISRRWSDAVGRDRFTLVTVPPPGHSPGLLWERICAVIGVSVDGTDLQPPANESLGAASSQMLRRLNLMLTDIGVDRRARRHFVKQVLAKKVLAANRPAEPSLGLDVSPFVRAKTEEMIAALRGMGVRVVGDLDELQPVPVSGIDPASVDPHQELEAALVGLAGLVQRQATGGSTSR